MKPFLLLTFVLLAIAQNAQKKDSKYASPISKSSDCISNGRYDLFNNTDWDICEVSDGNSGTFNFVCNTNYETVTADSTLTPTQLSFYDTSCGQGECFGSPFPVFLAPACQCDFMSDKQSEVFATNETVEFSIVSTEPCWMMISLESYMWRNSEFESFVVTVTELPADASVLFQHSFNPTNWNEQQ